LAATEIAPGLPEIEQARARLEGVARVTPVYRSETFSQLAGREVHLKAENLQRTGSFKVRGAYNRISTLSEAERAAGVVAASAGNHGQAVAWAAREVGSHARIFMPQDAPMAKVDATRHYGAEIELAGSNIEDALAGAQAYVAQTGATFVHPFEDPLVIAGQGTIGLELAEQVPDAGTVVIPIGGGGLASGIALALRAVRSDVRIVGVQAAGTLPDGPGFTIADGVAVKKPGELTASILDRVLDDVVSVTDEEITESIVLLLERTKLVVEGAGAVSVAAVLHGKVGGEGRVVPVLSGGNIDADAAHLRHAARSRRRRALPRPAHARTGPAGRARHAAHAARERSGERRRGRAPAGDRRPARRRDRRRAHTADTRRRALRRDPRHARSLGLSGRAPLVV